MSALPSVTGTRTASATTTRSRFVAPSLSATSTMTPTHNGVQAAPRQLVGAYIRIGVNPSGTLGSIGTAPPGIQYDYSGSGLFTDLNDFLTPGSPFEGWSLRYQLAGASGTQLDGNNNAATSARVAGTLTMYNGQAFAGEVWDQRAVWRGVKPGLYTIVHDVRFNHNDQVISIVTNVTLMPNASAMSGVFFGRFTDPDVMVLPGDSSSTRNLRGYGSIPRNNIVLAEALASGYTEGYLTAATNAGTGISRAWTQDPLDYWRGIDDGLIGDFTIGIGFNLSSLVGGQTSSVAYNYVFGTGLLVTEANVTVLPKTGTTLGGTIVTVSGVPVNTTDVLLCRFGTPGVGVGADVSATVPGVFRGAASVACAAPFSRKTGRAQVWLSRTGGASWVWVGVYVFTAPEAGGLPPLLLQPGAGCGPSDGGPLLWPSASGEGGAPTVSLILAWLLNDAELALVGAETLNYVVELFEVADPLGTSAAWLAAPRPAFSSQGGGAAVPAPPITAALQAALFVNASIAYQAMQARFTHVADGDLRRLGRATMASMSFGMSWAPRPGGSGTWDISGYLAVPVALNMSLDATLFARPVFARLSAFGDATTAAVFTRSSSLRWLLPEAPPAWGSRSPSPSASGVATPLPSSLPRFDTHAACTRWKALQLSPILWNGGMPRCPQTMAQASQALWGAMPECDGGVSMSAWGTAPCWLWRGRQQFGERGAASCITSLNYWYRQGDAACCYDAAGRLLRSGGGSASDYRFAPAPVAVAHLFADSLPRLVCCGLSPAQEDCDGNARWDGGFSWRASAGEGGGNGSFSWRGVGGTAGDPHFVTLDGARFTFNGAGDYAYLGVRTSPDVPPPAAAALAAASATRVLPPGVLVLSFLRLLPLSVVYTGGSSGVTAIRGWAAITAGGDSVSVTVHGGALTVVVNGSALQLGPSVDDFAATFAAARTGVARTDASLATLAARARFSATNGSDAAAASSLSAAAVASGALAVELSDVTQVVGNISVTYSPTRRSVLVALPAAGVSVTITQVASNVSALDGALLQISADVTGAAFNATFGLLGDFDGSPLNDFRTGADAAAAPSTGLWGAPPVGTSQRAVHTAISAALRLPTAASTFPTGLPILDAALPLFTDETTPAVAPDLMAQALAVCGAPATAASTGLTFLQNACVMDAIVTGALDVGTSTLRSLTALIAAQAAAQAAAPEFGAASPVNLTATEGRVTTALFTAAVPSLSGAAIAPAPVAFDILSSPSGACTIGRLTGLLSCAPLAMSSAGLSGGIGTVALTATSIGTGAASLLQVLLTVVPMSASPSASTAPASPLATPLATLSLSAAPTATASPSAAPTAAASPSAASTATMTPSAAPSASPTVSTSLSTAPTATSTALQSLSGTSSASPSVLSVSPTATESEGAAAAAALAAANAAQVPSPSGSGNGGVAAGGAIAALALIGTLLVARRRMRGSGSRGSGAGQPAAAPIVLGPAQPPQQEVLWSDNAAFRQKALSRPMALMRGDSARSTRELNRPRVARADFQPQAAPTEGHGVEPARAAPGLNYYGAAGSAEQARIARNLALLAGATRVPTSAALSRSLGTPAAASSRSLDMNSSGRSLGASGRLLLARGAPAAGGAQSASGRQLSPGGASARGLSVGGSSARVLSGLSPAV